MFESPVQTNDIFVKGLKHPIGPASPYHREIAIDQNFVVLRDVQLLHEFAELLFLREHVGEGTLLSDIVDVEESGLRNSFPIEYFLGVVGKERLGEGGVQDSRPFGSSEELGGFLWREKDLPQKLTH